MTVDSRPGITVTFDQVSKRYRDKVALKDVSLSAGPGITSLVGQNGAGKSTALTLIAGLIEPSHGTVDVTLDDGTVPDAFGIRSLLGLVRQECGAYPFLTVDEQVDFAIGLSGAGRVTRRSRRNEVVDQLDLGPLRRTQVSQLSLGQRRRVWLACALVRRPRLLLLDEVTSGVDIQTRRSILDLVRSIAATGATIVYSTHYLAEVDQLKGRVVVLHHGSRVADGGYAELMERFGGAAVRFTFAEDGIELPSGVVARWEGPRLAVVQPVGSPGSAVAQLLRELGQRADDVTSIELVEATFETAYLAAVDRVGEQGTDAPAGRAR